MQKKLLGVYQTWNGNGEKTQNFVQIDYNDLWNFKGEQFDTGMQPLGKHCD